LKPIAPDHNCFGHVFDMDTTTNFSKKVYDKVIAKLQTEAIEDFRIDFEDGYGNRSNEEEDETARTAALEVAIGMKENTLPPFIGIRIKPFTEEMKERGLRTLDIFVSTLVKETGGKLPDNFIVMLPKVTIPEQPATLASFFDILEEELKMEQGTLKMEMMVETTQAIMDIDGTNPLYRFIKHQTADALPCTLVPMIIQPVAALQLSTRKWITRFAILRIMLRKWRWLIPESG